MCMATLTRRVQILLDDERYRLLEREAERQGVPVAALIREAIDRSFAGGGDTRAHAAAALLAAEAMPVDDWSVMKERMLDELAGGGA